MAVYSQWRAAGRQGGAFSVCGWMSSWISDEDVSGFDLIFAANRDRVRGCAIMYTNAPIAARMPKTTSIS